MLMSMSCASFPGSGNFGLRTGQDRHSAFLYEGGALWRRWRSLGLFSQGLCPTSCGHRPLQHRSSGLFAVSSLFPPQFVSAYRSGSGDHRDTRNQKQVARFG
jgi:hypothetical protein